MGNLQVVGGIKKLNNKNCNTRAICMESYLQGQDLWEVVDGGEFTQLAVEDANGILRKWKIKAGKEMFALKTTIEEEIVRSESSYWGNHEAMAKQMRGVSLKGEEKALYSSKSRGTFQRYTNSGSKKDDDKVKNYQGKGGSYSGGASKNRGNSRKFDGKCYNCEKMGHMPKTVGPRKTLLAIEKEELALTVTTPEKINYENNWIIDSGYSNQMIGKEFCGGKCEESLVGLRASSVSKHGDAMMSSQEMLGAVKTHQGELDLEVHQVGAYLNVVGKGSGDLKKSMMRPKRPMVLWSPALINCSPWRTVMALKSEVNELKKELIICNGAMSEWGVLKTFLEGLRPGVMLGGEQGDAQRLSEAIAVAGKLTELTRDKPTSIVSSRSMPRNSEPSTVRSQGKPSGKNDKTKSGVKKKTSKKKLKCYFCDGPHLIRGCPKKRLLATIMKKMGEGEVAGIGAAASVKAVKPGKRLGPIEGVNVVKQGTRRGKVVDFEAVEPRGKSDAIASVQVIRSEEGLGEATCSKVAKSRGQHGATTCSQVVNLGSRHDEIASVKALEHRKGPRILKEYVSRFRKLMFKVLSLTEEDGFFTFMFGLKPWTKKMLERREVKELSKTMTTSESIREFGVKKSKTSKARPKDEGVGVGRASVTKAISSQRNGFNIKHGSKNYPTSKSGNADPHLLARRNISGRSSNATHNNWKNYEEKEFMWKMLSRLSQHDAVNISNNSRKDHWTLDPSEKLVRFKG
ncbi:hypothetical protein F3Y22_tig00110387pilonHSYRG00212 [Hibiscus syriacus]|uniref:Uncharacterized protein n=1 Tax=Hibiscus syriacus TaxID=106335 RepID=A0A6A3AV00_HIBSY|nr:hypothetical protein F3Y22_tig00110387pilonHSYRG00212 [Hibiscus syriacus]